MIKTLKYIKFLLFNQFDINTLNYKIIFYTILTSFNYFIF